MKFGHLIEYNEKYFPSKIMQKVSQGDQFQTSLFFEKNFNLGKGKWSAAQFQYTAIVLNLTYNKNKLHKTLGF